MRAVIVSGHGGDYRDNSEQLLSLLEAEHEALKTLADSIRAKLGYDTGRPDPEAFRVDVNRILEAHLGLAIN